MKIMFETIFMFQLSTAVALEKMIPFKESLSESKFHLFCNLRCFEKWIVFLPPLYSGPSPLGVVGCGCGGGCTGKHEDPGLQLFRDFLLFVFVGVRQLSWQPTRKNPQQK